MSIFTFIFVPTLHKSPCAKYITISEATYRVTDFLDAAPRRWLISLATAQHANAYFTELVMLNTYAIRIGQRLLFLLQIYGGYYY